MERTAAYCHLHRSAKHTANGTSCGSAVAVVKGDCTLIASCRAARLPILPVRTPESLWFQTARLYLESHHSRLPADSKTRRRHALGVYYDAENPGVYLENFVVESWAEHTRQHDRFTVADRKFEERVLGLVLESPKTRHFLYANRVERVSTVRETKQ
jgi:hypothetical protein